MTYLHDFGIAEDSPDTVQRRAELNFSRNRFTTERDQMNALYFLNGDVQRQVIDQERKDSVIQNYQRDSGLSGRGRRSQKRRSR